MRDHLSDWLRVGGGALEVRWPGFCSFLQTVILARPCLCRVSTLQRFRSIWFWVLRGLYPVLFKVLLGVVGLLLGYFATIQVLVLLEGQQVGLLLLQLFLELLGLALLLELPPFVLLRAGRIKLNQNHQEQRRMMEMSCDLGMTQG